MKPFRRTTPAPELLGPARAGALREEVSFSDFEVSVDLVNLGLSPVDTDLGLVARVGDARDADGELPAASRGCWCMMTRWPAIKVRWGLSITSRPPCQSRRRSASPRSARSARWR